MTRTKVLHWAIAARNVGTLVMVAFVCGSCGKPVSGSVAGTYTRKDGPLVETIVLRTNGTFNQTVVYSDGQTFKVSDQWTNKHRQVKFSRLYITRDVETSKVLLPPEIRYGVNFMWAKGVLAKDTEQGYLLRLKQP